VTLLGAKGIFPWRFFYKDDMRYLSFDVSSTTIGWSYITTNNNKIEKIDGSYFKPPKGMQISKLKRLRHKFCIFDGYKPDMIAIEEYPMFMSNHKSTARTISTLAIYTRIVALFLHEQFDIEPIFYPVVTIRSVLRKLSGSNDKISKENVPSVIESIVGKHIPEWKFQYETNKKGKVKTEMFDVADAVAVGMTCAYKNGELK